MATGRADTARLKSMELEKRFNPAEFEGRVYQMWQEGNYFSPESGYADTGKTPFVIVIPPPNVTGVLHLGHGLNNSLQDVLIRFYRMLGHPTLWVPGTDHAGIATQNVVERMVRGRGSSREQMGREAFVAETERVALDHKTTIRRQLQKIGASCDWSRERFTLDEGLSRAVREVFVQLYERNLIYRGNYLVNWCASCGTALSDDEVEHSEIQGALYHYFYPMVDGSGRIEVATTRPETMLGDTCVAVNPKDTRYQGCVGKEVRLPLTDRILPIVADDYVDMTFGTGAVKVTPGHDANDYEIGLRHNLERINILNPDGTLSDAVPKRYRGLPVVEARRRVVADLKEQGYFLGQEDHNHQVGHCYRCNSLIEPFLSEQWFVRMQPLAEKALAAWERGELLFYPRRWENTYTHWLREIRDWCISRQLWWGHRIPVWYCSDCGQMTVSREDISACGACGSAGIRQDEDVLDTWFSSWLWPFSTLGWPEETADLEQYFPTTTLVTGYDIIFFWVARMIMASLEFLEEVPFRDIYITSLVRDKQGRKMSKSLGNGIDPLEVVDEYGADALKFTLAFLSAQGQDILLGHDTFAIGSKFANKIWNAARYLLMNLGERRVVPLDEIELRETDRWIYHRLNYTVERVQTGMREYRFDDVGHAVYEFFWNDFCDWYIELSKLQLYSDDETEQDRAASLLLHLLEESMRLMHPLLPFVTEEIYQKLPALPRCNDRDGNAEEVPALIVARFPEPSVEREATETATQFAALQELVSAVRTLRSEFTLPPAMKVRFLVRTEPRFSAAEFLERHKGIIALLTGADESDDGIVFVRGDTVDSGRLEGSVAVVGAGFEAHLYVRELIDVDAAARRFQKELEKHEKAFERSRSKLDSPGFLEKAGAEVVAKERERKRELATQIAKLQQHLASLKVN